jgi:hypothetical protein
VSIWRTREDFKGWQRAAVGQFASQGICLAKNQLTPQPRIIPRQAQTTDASALSHREMG